MKSVLLLLFSTLFLACSAEKQECTEKDDCALGRNADAVSMLQSRDVEISYEEPQDLKPSVVGLQTADSVAEARPHFVIGQRVERRDEKEGWGVGIVTSVDPLLVTAGENPYFDQNPEEYTEGYEWAEVRVLPQVNKQEMQSELLTRQLWAQAIQSGWSTGIAAVLFVAIIYMLHKLRIEKRERLEKRVHEVLCPQGATDILQAASQEPQKYARDAQKKKETSAFGAAEQEENDGEEHLVGVKRYLLGLPQVMKDQLQETVRTALTPTSAGETSPANSDEGDAQCAM